MNEGVTEQLTIMRGISFVVQPYIAARKLEDTINFHFPVAAN